MPTIRCMTPVDADAAVVRVQRERGDGLFLFFGSEDPQTGESWCPDCVVADPVVRRACKEFAPALTVYECPVGVRSDWKNQPQHPFRLHPAMRLARIPTLVRIRGGVEIGRLVEGDCADQTKLRAFLAGAS